jgi:hypothetical protein
MMTMMVLPILSLTVAEAASAGLNQGSVIPHNCDRAAHVGRQLPVFGLQVQTKLFFCRERLAIPLDPKLPFGDMADHPILIGGSVVFDPGCMMMSRSWTFLKPGMMAGVSR